MGPDRPLHQQVFEQFPQALIIVDRESTVVALNAAAERLTGWSSADAVGRPSADILEVRTETGLNLCAPHGPLRRALRRGDCVNTHFAYLFRLRTADDPVRVAYSIAPLRVRETAIAGAVITLHDVTPELETIQAKDALMLAASHELKTPMTSIKGLSELLLDFELTDDQRRELLRDLHVQADRMERLIGDMLEVSRIESGRLTLSPARVEVEAVIEHVRRDVEPALRGRVLHCRIEDHTPPIWGDRQKLHQILVNLVTNAIKYSDDGTPITLTAGAHGGMVRLEVIDEGQGIRKEHLPRLFEKFYRADDPAVRRTAGTGLGLYIVRNLVDMLGGHVDVQSHYGRGTVFTVLLPQAEVGLGKRQASSAAR